MAYQSLYRRYRSQKFAEILGQPHVTTGLKSAIADGRYGHAYLFSGPRGTGKTSTARVLAKALNCENLTGGEPCGTCESCVAIENGKSFDLHELDAASNNKVDDIRDLISKVQLGSPGRTKVYILDEVHMLSSGAENALLKTLEEPPDHVVFVLATTEPQKVVPTIRSRTQHFQFHLLPADVLADHVRSVIADAELDVEADAIEYVLRQGGGSARDTLSALDLVAAAGGVPEGNDIAESLVRAIGQRDPAAAVASIQTGLELGREPRTVGEDTLDLLRNAFLASMGAPLGHLNDHAESTSQEFAGLLGPATLTRSLESIGQALVEMRQAPDPRVPLEVAVLRLTRGSTESSAEIQATIEALEARLEALEAGRSVPATAGSGGPAPAAAPANPDAAKPVGEPASTPSPAPRSDAASSPPAGATRAPVPADLADGVGRRSRPPRSPRSTQRRPGEATVTEAASDRPATRPVEAPTSDPPAAETPAGGDSPDATKANEAAPDTASAATPADPQQGDASGGESPTGESPVGDQPADVAPSALPDDGSAAAGASEAAGQASEASEHASSSAGVATAGAAVGSTLDVGAVSDALRLRLDDLSQKVRARFKGGRIVAVDGSTIRFGAPNQIHRDRCDDVKADVEQALSEHFGQPITVEVVIDTASEAPIDPAKLEQKPAPPPADTSAEEAEIGPVADLADATDQSSRGVDRITKAFPGSQVVDTGID